MGISLIESAPNLLYFTDPGTGEGPLHVAVTQNDESLVTVLLELGASLATQDLEGRTPVMAACDYGHMQALEALATRGVNMAGEREKRRGREGGREVGGREGGGREEGGREEEGRGEGEGGACTHFDTSNC